MDQIMNYVKPELLVVAVVLYFVGVFLKQAETVADKYIPGILGLLGVVICGDLCFRYIYSHRRSGSRNGNLYRNHTRYSCRRTEYLCESGH